MAADRANVDRAITAAADVLRPWSDGLHVGPDTSGPAAAPLVVDPATAIAGLSLLLSVLTFWQTERHHRQEMDRLDRDAAERRAAMHAETANLRLPPEQVVAALAEVPPDDLARARAAIADDPTVRTDVAALLGRAGVPVADVAHVLDDLSRSATDSA